MDKIINNGYKCSCNGMSDDALVKIVEGNDLTLDIQLTKYNTEQEIWESYSLVGKDDVQCYLLTPNGTHIDLDTEVQLDGKVKAKVESYMVETNMTYGVGIDWKYDDNDLSVKVKDIVQIIRYSEVNDEYNVEVDESATYISIGQLPQDAITPDELTVVLDNYVTNSSLSTTLNDYVQDSDLDNYVTDSDLSTVLEDYITEADMSQFVTNSELSTALQPYATTQYVDEAISDVDLTDYYDKTEVDNMLSDYVTDSELSTSLQPYATTQYVDNAISSIPGVDLSDYYDKTEVDNMLSDYVSDSELSTTLNDYVTDSELATSLNPYVSDSELTTTLADYVTNTSLNTTLNNYVTDSELATSLNPYVTSSALTTTLADYVTDNQLSSTLQLYVSDSELSTTLADYVTGTSLNTTLNDYVTDSELTSELSPIESDITSLDGRVTTLEQNPSVPSNVVTSDDANEIVLLTQSEYDALVNGGTVDQDALYYITDTNSNYVTNSQMTAALADYALETDLNSAESDISSLDTRVTALENGGGGGGTPTNMVTTDTTQTISGTKTFTANNTFNGESKFIDTQNNHTVSFSDNCYEIAKSGIFGRGSFIQACIGQILAPRTAVSNSTNKYDNQVGTILFQTINGSTGSPNYNPLSLTTIAKIDSNGIYEGTTLLANKYVQSSSIRNIVQISQSDYDNLVNGGTVDANTMYVII